MISAGEWSPTGGLSLEPNALQAVRELKKNIVVAAGPGAGKTELLAQRADLLFRTAASPYPQRILAISFKVDAARNLQSRVRLRSGSQFAARFDSLTFHAFAKRLIDNYRPALTGQNALAPDYRVDLDTRIEGEQITFKEFIPFAIEILENNRFARGAVRQTYSHVFLDEFQDATAEQYEFLKLAFGNSAAVITAVGDVKQTIMAWAGALDGVMKRFAADYEAESLPLYQNFRSKPRLRRMQNRMVLDMDPSAASPEADLLGDEGAVRVLSFENEIDEANAVSNLVSQWLVAGTSPKEIGVLIRNQPHLIGASLFEELRSRGIAFRNEQESQDLASEPVAALIFNYLRVIADERRPDAYSELVRVATSNSATEIESQVFESRLRQILNDARTTVRAPNFDGGDFDFWKPILRKFLNFIPRPVLSALSASYQQGDRLKQVRREAVQAFKRELSVDGNPVEALNRLSAADAIRILTIHKCKGLEFSRVVVIGVESDLFFGKPAHVASEFFVAISRAKDELVLTHAVTRSKPDGANDYWKTQRTAYDRLLAYAIEPQ